MIKQSNHHFTEIHSWGHAGWSVFCKGCHLVMDPVLDEPFELGNSFFNPPREVDKGKIPRVDIIYISHIHMDHCDKPTLEYFAKKYQPQILCPNDLDLKGKLAGFGFEKIKPMKAWESFDFGPFHFFTTPSISYFSEIELGLVITAGGMTLWNQIDTSVDLRIIWTVKNKLGCGPDIVFCPFQPMREWTSLWPEETDFPHKRLENMISKALALEARHVILASGSICAKKGYEFLNPRWYPVSKPQFIKRLKDKNPSQKAYDIEAGAVLRLDTDKNLMLGSSHFIKQTGEREDFSEKPFDFPHAPQSPLSPSDWRQIVFILKKLPRFLSLLRERMFVHWLELASAKNYRILIEITDGEQNQSFLFHEGISKLEEVCPPIDWDYRYRYSAGDLLARMADDLKQLDFHITKGLGPKPRIFKNYEKSNLESPLELSGYREEHTVDGYNFEDHPLFFWPFPLLKK